MVRTYADKAVELGRKDMTLPKINPGARLPRRHVKLGTVAPKLTLNQSRFLRALTLWLAQDQPGLSKRGWLRAGGISGYFRLTQRYLNGVACKSLDVATIEVPVYLRGRGTLKAILQLCLRHTKREVVFAEAVGNPWLLTHYLNPKNGWLPSDIDPTSFFRKTNAD